MELDSWTLLVIAGVYVGMEVSRARAIREGLSVKVTVDTSLLMVVIAFVFAHFLHVLGYNWDKFAEDPLILFQVWNGFSSTGGFIGAAIAVPLLMRLYKAPAWPYADCISMGFMAGWVLGRLGCFTAHDHKGALSHFALAVDFPSGARHDLGLYEAILALLILTTMKVLDRKPRFHGFFVGVMMILYAPPRFAMDFLRATDLPKSDTRYFGLTPAQYVCVGIFLGGIFLLQVRSRAGRQDTTGESERDFSRPRTPPPMEDQGGMVEADTQEASATPSSSSSSSSP